MAVAWAAVLTLPNSPMPAWSTVQIVPIILCDAGGGYITIGRCDGSATAQDIPALEPLHQLPDHHHLVCRLRVCPRQSVPAAQSLVSPYRRALQCRPLPGHINLQDRGVAVQSGALFCAALPDRAWQLAEFGRNEYTPAISRFPLPFQPGFTLLGQPSR